MLDSFRSLEAEGFKVTYLPVEKDGKINLETLENALTDDTIAASIMMINNETGTLQNMVDIGRICKSKKVFFHSDVAQAFGKMPIDVNEMGLDLASISGHKIYGPKGIGALFVRRKPRVRLLPIISGGGQERGLRSGTLPTHLCVGLGEAARVAGEEMAFDLEWVRSLKSYFLNDVISKIPRVHYNGDRSGGYPGIINVSFEFIEGESLIMSIKNCAVSSGSACTSASLEPSYVLRALGVNEELAHTSIRFGFGRFTLMQEVKFLGELLQKRVEILREMSPLWEFEQEGVSLDTIEWTKGTSPSQ